MRWAQLFFKRGFQSCPAVRDICPHLWLLCSEVTGCLSALRPLLAQQVWGRLTGEPHTLCQGSESQGLDYGRRSGALASDPKSGLCSPT